MDKTMAMALIGFIILTISVRQQETTKRLKILEATSDTVYVRPDTVYVAVPSVDVADTTLHDEKGEADD